MKRTVFPLLVLASFGFTGTVLGHSVNGLPGGYGGGLVHPWLGADHLVAALAIGFWATACSQGTWRLPAVFLIGLGAGLLLGMNAASWAGIKAGIVISLVVLGVLISCGARASTGIALAFAGIAAVFHGHAHGMEMVRGASSWAFGAGILSGSILLLGCGAALGKLLQADAVRSRRWAGAAVAVSGLIFGLWH